MLDGKLARLEPIVRFAARSHCLSYSRTFVAPREDCNLGAREQANMATSFLDGSHVSGD